jgi:hypothetical protein
MGNMNTKTNKNETVLNPEIHTTKQLVDDVALKYILTMNFESLTKMHQKEYCDKLVILTSKIIEEKLHPIEITYLAKQNKDKLQTQTEKMIFTTGENIQEWNTQSSLEKKEMCNGIAKFYIQIAHIYSAIIKTINPIYIYKNSSGETIEVPLSERHSIPIGTSVHIKSFNICERNIEILKRQTHKDSESDSDLEIKHPNSCDLNEIDIDNSSKTLMDEPGIPELQHLYEDSDYDFSEGKFKGMNAKTKAKYMEDLLLFYNVFTGSDEEELPKDVKTFSDIKLSKYKGNLQCKKSTSQKNSNLKEETKIKIEEITNNMSINSLLTEYAENIKNMLVNMNKNRQLLLDILNKLFKYYHNPTTGKKEIKINNELKESDIPDIILETRHIIVELYLTCERDYSRGMEIYEAIVDKKILDTAESQIQYFHSMLDEIHG